MRSHQPAAATWAAGVVGATGAIALVAAPAGEGISTRSMGRMLLWQAATPLDRILAEAPEPSMILG